MKLPVTFEQFSKDPVKAVTFCMLVVVAYLWYDNKTNYQNQIDVHQEKIVTLEKKIDKCFIYIKKADSALAAANTKLEVLTALGHIPK
jgi:hypothetical protein